MAPLSWEHLSEVGPLLHFCFPKGEGAGEFSGGLGGMERGDPGRMQSSWRGLGHCPDSLCMSTALAVSRVFS